MLKVGDKVVCTRRWRRTAREMGITYHYDDLRGEVVSVSPSGVVKVLWSGGSRCDILEDNVRKLWFGRW